MVSFTFLPLYSRGNKNSKTGNRNMHYNENIEVLSLILYAITALLIVLLVVLQNTGGHIKKIAQLEKFDTERKPQVLKTAIEKTVIVGLLHFNAVYGNRIKK
jgi:hypothetical protein